MKKLKSIITLIFIIAFLIVVFFAPFSERLCIISAEDSRILFILERHDDEFSISYTHSVNRGRVRDSYVVDGGRLRLSHTNFVSYGAGIPEPEDAQVFKLNDDSFEISNINLVLEELVLQTGVVADHHLETYSKTIIFNDYIPYQTRIIIGVKKISRFQALTAIFN